MPRKVTLSSADEGFELDDAGTRRPWPIAASSQGLALILPQANYRVDAAGGVTRALHSAAVASGGAGPLAAGDRRPAVAPYQTAADRVAALFTVGASGTRLSFAQYAIRPGSALAQTDDTTDDDGLASGLGYTAGRDRISVVLQYRISATATRTRTFIQDGINLRSSVAAAERPDSELADYSSLHCLAYDPGDTLDTWADRDQGDIKSPAWVTRPVWLDRRHETTSVYQNQNPPESAFKPELRYLALEPGRVRSDAPPETGATALEHTIELTDLQKADIMADAADPDGESAWVAQIVGASVVVSRARDLRSAVHGAPADTLSTGLPADASTAAHWDNIYLAVNGSFVWVVALNRAITDGRPDVRYQRYDRVGRVWDPSWTVLVTGRDWEAGDTVAHQAAITRVPHGSTIGLCLTRRRRGRSNVTYLYLDTAGGAGAPVTPAVTSPGRDGAAPDVMEPLLVAWSYYDPQGSPQAFRRIRRRAGGVDNWWTGGGWTAVLDDSSKLAGDAQQVTLPARWAAAGSADWTLHVTVWDDAGNESSESAGRTFTPGGKAVPSLSASTSGLRVRATWRTTGDTQAAYRLDLLDAAGRAVVVAGPWVAGAGKSATVDAPLPGRYTARVTTRSRTGYEAAGTATATATDTSRLSQPRLTVTPQGAALRVAVSRLPPAADHWVLRRRKAGGAEEVTLHGGRRIDGAVPAYDDHTVESGQDYEYQAVAVDVSAAQARSSGWTG